MMITDIKKDDIDVEDIMRQIRENIEKRKEGGIQIKREKTGIGKYDLQHNLDYINSNWDVSAEYSISSHRPILGRLIVWGRRLIHGEIRRYVDLIARRQTEFNMHVARLLKGVDNRINETVADNVNQVIAAANNDIKNKAWLASLLDERIKKNIKKIVPAQHDKIMNYFVFEEKYRGSTEDIKKRQTIFLEYFKNCQNVLDIGCGRGEFLSLLKENGIGGKGIDTNDDMVLYCQKDGLDVQKVEALSYLQSLEDKSLDGIFSGQVIEHIQPVDLINLVKLCYDKMKYGTYFIAETINPLCLSVFSKSFYMDMSHVKPVHPATIKFLMESVGFRDVDFKFFSPHTEEAKLSKFKITDELDDKNRQQLELMNQNIDKLNELLYGYQDYAVIGKK